MRNWWEKAFFEFDMGLGVLTELKAKTGGKELAVIVDGGVWLGVDGKREQQTLVMRQVTGIVDRR
jgi:hypothetical protein